MVSIKNLLSLRNEDHYLSIARMFVSCFRRQFIACIYYLSSLFKFTNDLKWMKSTAIIHQIPLEMFFSSLLRFCNFPMLPHNCPKNVMVRVSANEYSFLLYSCVYYSLAQMAENKTWCCIRSEVVAYQITFCNQVGRDDFLLTLPPFEPI